MVRKSRRRAQSVGNYAIILMMIAIIAIGILIFVSVTRRSSGPPSNTASPVATQSAP